MNSCNDKLTMSWVRCSFVAGMLVSGNVKLSKDTTTSESAPRFDIQYSDLHVHHARVILHAIFQGWTNTLSTRTLGDHKTARPSRRKCDHLPTAMVKMQQQLAEHPVARGCVEGSERQEKYSCGQSLIYHGI